MSFKRRFHQTRFTRQCSLTDIIADNSESDVSAGNHDPDPDADADADANGSACDLGIAAADIRSFQQERRRKRINTSRITANAAAVDVAPSATGVADHVMTAAAPSDGVESGARWLTGISEIPLSDEVSANRKRTAAAVKRYESANAAAPVSSVPASAIGGSFAANFIALNTAAPTHKADGQRATDKQVADKFIKRTKPRG